MTYTPIKFAMDCLDPERFGFKVSAEVRDAARESLGIPKVEMGEDVKPEEFDGRGS